MTLKQLDYDEAYFMQNSKNVDRPHKAGYTNYFELQTNYIAERNIKAFLKRHNIPKNAKILELGAAVGFMGKVATEEGYTNWTCVDWSSWCKQNEVYPVIEQDVLSYLRAQADNSFDYIISRLLIECIPTNKLQNHAVEAKRVASKHIHAVSLQTNQYYNIKTLPEWTDDFLNDPDIIIQDFRKDG